MAISSAVPIGALRAACVFGTVLLIAGFASQRTTPAVGSDASGSQAIRGSQLAAAERRLTAEPLPIIRPEGEVTSPAISSESRAQPEEPIEPAAALPPVEDAVMTPVITVGAVAWKPLPGHWRETGWLPRNQAASTVDRIVAAPYGYRGVDFPHVGTARDLLAERAYAKVVSFFEDAADDAPRRPIPHVRCMGLSPQSLARRAAGFERPIVELAIRHNVSASLVKAVITEESCFDPAARSPVGAIGLMQLMPATAAWLGVEDPTDPLQNLDGGIRYLARLQKQYPTNALALAAYNSGPGSVQRYGGVPPFPETVRYIKRVEANYRRYVTATRLANAATLALLAER